MHSTIFKTTPSIACIIFSTKYYTNFRRIDNTSTEHPRVIIRDRRLQMLKQQMAQTLRLRI